MSHHNDSYKWYLLALVVLTNMFVIAVPTMGMSVMSKEISNDLGLDLVQLGIVWGVGALPGIVTSLLGGMIGDKFGPKRVLIVGSLIGGVLGMARGFAFDFASITIIIVLLGAITPVVLMNGYKVIGQWFPSHQLGLANGLIAMGMALGFLLGSFFSATTLSPWLGGWRNVLIAYGVIGALFCIPWLFSQAASEKAHPTSTGASIWKPLKHVAGLKNIWLLGLALFGVAGAIQGMLGYLPLYLRDMGWQPLHADGAPSAFHLVSMTFVLPFSLWSDRLGSRKRLILIANLAIVIGVGLLSFVSGGIIWAAVLLAGFMRDTFWAMITTMVIETRNVGPAFAGTATGFVMAFGSLNSFLAPPIGNSLASLWSGSPFAFWAALSVFGLICLSLVEAGGRSEDVAVGELIPLKVE